MASSKKLPANPADSSEAVIQVQDAIASCVEKQPEPFLVGFSGGLDSVVLLHAAGAVCGANTVTAVHVNHGLQADAHSWAEQCAQTAATLNVSFHGENAAPRPTRFVNGLESWARDLIIVTIRPKPYFGILHAARVLTESLACGRK